jgi:hypothetical protein
MPRHIRIFLCLISTLLVICCTRTDSRYPPFLFIDDAYSPPTQEQKLWALATCAILTESNCDRHDLLGGCKRQPAKTKVRQEILSEWWGVNNRKDLLKTLEWLENGGHRREFDKMAGILTSAKPAQIDELKRKYANVPEITNKIVIVLKYKDDFGPKSITAWDFSRYVSLCGWGYIAGYLNEDEAWRRIMPAARMLQKTFTSWEDLGKNHVVGREFWSLEQTKARGDLTRSCYAKLLISPSSPWSRIRWDLDLTAPKAKGAKTLDSTTYCIAIWQRIEAMTSDNLNTNRLTLFVHY